ETEKALAVCEKALPLMKRTSGVNHPQTRQCIQRFGESSDGRGRSEQAIELLEQAYRGFQTVYGNDHPRTVSTMNALAVVYWSEKRLDQSIPLLENALKQREATLGRRHPETVTVLGNLGMNYASAGRFTEALPLLEEAVENSLNGPIKINFAIPLIDTYTRTEQAQKAVEAAKQHTLLAVKLGPSTIAGFTNQLAVSASMLIEKEAVAEAALMARACLRIRERHLPESWLTFRAHALVGRTMLVQGNYELAEQSLVKGYEGMVSRMDSIPSASRTSFIETLEALIGLYQALDQEEQVLRWQTELEKQSDPADDDD
ncbi:MAG: tetratricopeptide repeat protein, partial [Planctomycetota bacterium]